MTRRELMIDTIGYVCCCAIGNCGIRRVCGNDIDEIEAYIELLEKLAEMGDITESDRELFAAARHIAKAIQKGK